MTVKHKIGLFALLFIACASIVSGQSLYDVDWDINCNTTLPQWTIVKGEWECGVIDGSNGLIAVDEKGLILGTSDFAGCDICTVRNAFKFELRPPFQAGPEVSFLAWYRDEDNFVELSGHLRGNNTVRYTLKQLINGKVAAKTKSADIPLISEEPHYWENIAIRFDGVKFIVITEFAGTFEMEKAPGSAPFGSVGYKTKNAAGARFGALGVTTP